MFPQPFKIAKVIPLFKKESPLLVSNYRPISLVPIFSKIFEKLMFNRITAFFDKYNIISPSQFGFQTNKSTELAVNEICTFVKDTFENKETGFCIFLDFAKAFDTVNHEILLHKLEHYGIRGTALLWFRNYLKDRQQHTEIGNTLSDSHDIHCGVPQGSILGPLLFLVYINDIVHSSTLLKFCLFADDTTIYYSSKVDAETESILNAELSKVYNWLCCNKLSLNMDKSSYLEFTNMKSDKVTLKMANRVIDQKSVAKYLGVLIDEKLSWKPHIDNINLKIRRGIGMISKVRSFLLPTTIKTLYYSFIYPYLDYNILNWSSSSSPSIDCLRISNEKAIRQLVVGGARQQECTSIFKELKILPLDSLIKFRRASFMWKLNNNILPHPSSSWFKINYQVSHDNQPVKKFLLPQPRTVIASRHNTFTATKLWNTDIPYHLKQSPFFDTFKRNFKNYLLTQL